MTDAQVLKLMGGALFLQRELLIGIDAARKINSRGIIPWKYRPTIRRIAQRKHIKLPADFLEVQRAA